MEILYEDNHLIAVYKDPGIPVQADKSNDPNLLDQVKYYLKQKYGKPGRVFLGLVHRLDRPVGGVMVFGKTSKGAARLSEQFRKHTIIKKYWALLSHCPENKQALLTHYLLKNKRENKVQVFNEPHVGALCAQLKYQVLQKAAGRCLAEIELLTGRPHQIRAQLGAIGCPLVGDVKYGGPEHVGGRPALLAHSLTFQKATVPETVSVSAPEQKTLEFLHAFLD